MTTSVHRVFRVPYFIYLDTSNHKRIGSATKMILALPLTVLLLSCLPDTWADIRILQDTVWNSYRHLTEPVVIFPNVTLRIQGNRSLASSSLDDEPVLLHFTPRKTDRAVGFRLHTDASLLVDYAVLTTHPTFDRRRDGGHLVSFVDPHGTALVQFTNAQCSNMSTCIKQKNWGRGSLHIENSTFLHNFIALRGLGGTTVRNCIFADNHMAIDDGSKWRMEGCVFLRNDMASKARDSLYLHCLFLDNFKGVSDPDPFLRRDPPFLQDCLFYRNQIGIVSYSTFGGYHFADIQDVTFLDNYVGIEANGKLGLLDRVNFIKTESVHVKYTGKSVTNPGANVYWGSSNLTKIRSRIYDAYHGADGGVVQIQGFWTKPRHHNVFRQGFDPAIHLAPFYNTSILSPGHRPTIPIPSYKTNLTDQEREWSDEKDVLDYTDTDDDEPTRKNFSAQHSYSAIERKWGVAKDFSSLELEGYEFPGDKETALPPAHEGHPVRLDNGGDGVEKGDAGDGKLLPDGDGGDEESDLSPNAVPPLVSKHSDAAVKTTTAQRLPTQKPTSRMAGQVPTGLLDEIAGADTVHGQESPDDRPRADAVTVGVGHKRILPIVLLSIAVNVLLLWILSLVVVVYCCKREPKQKTEEEEDEEASLLPLRRRVRSVRARIVRRRQRNI